MPPFIRKCLLEIRLVRGFSHDWCQPIFRFSPRRVCGIIPQHLFSIAFDLASFQLMVAQIQVAIGDGIRILARHEHTHLLFRYLCIGRTQITLTLSRANDFSLHTNADGKPNYDSREHLPFWKPIHVCMEIWSCNLLQFRLNVSIYPLARLRALHSPNQILFFFLSLHFVLLILLNFFNFVNSFFFSFKKTGSVLPLN